MSIHDRFSICAFKMIISVLSWILILPQSAIGESPAYAVTLLVFVMGKIIEQIVKVEAVYSKLLTGVYLAGIVIGIIDVGFLFWSLLNSNYQLLPYLLYLTILIFSIDALDFLLSASKFIKTKNKINPQ